jgi:DNA-binding LacI/PurR family transcriptional regulator
MPTTLHKRNTRPSSKDVAELARVSRATVSAYINKTHYVSSELSERISAAIKELNYTPDPLARALKLKDTRTIGLIIPVLSQFYMPLMMVINAIAHKNGYGFLLASSEEDPERERKVLEILLAKRISGILLVPCSQTNLELLKQVLGSGTPVVQVNRRLDGLGADSVVSNNFRAAYIATEHLIQRGRRKIVLLGYDPNSLANAEKKAGYDAALKDHNITDDLTILLQEHDGKVIRAAMIEFLNSGQPFDGLICTTQGKTAIALSLLKDRGIKIPEQVAVIGFDDTPWSSLLCTPLTVISESTYRMGMEAANLLLKRMIGKKTGFPSHILLEDELIVREST